jgi:hypothetical protein
MHINSRNNSKKVVIIVVAIAIILAVIGAAGYFYLHRNDIKRDENGVSIEQTPQDKKQEQDLKDDPTKKQQPTQTDRPTEPTVDQKSQLQQVNVVLTNTGVTNGTVSASGFVSNVIESNGTCKYIFTNGQKTVEKTSTTLTNPTSTTCKTVEFNSSELGTGTWKVKINYSSSASTGVSNELEVTIT